MPGAVGVPLDTGKLSIVQLIHVIIVLTFSTRVPMSSVPLNYFIDVVNWMFMSDNSRSSSQNISLTPLKIFR